MRTLLIIALVAGTAFGQGAGTWRLNPDKTTANDNELLSSSLVMRYEPHPEGEAVTTWRVTHDKRSETVSYILRYDGKDYPYPLQRERADSMCARKLEDGSTEVLGKKAGNVVSQEIRRLSADGRQMTIRLRLLSKDGG